MDEPSGAKALLQLLFERYSRGAVGCFSAGFGSGFFVDDWTNVLPSPSPLTGLAVGAALAGVATVAEDVLERRRSADEAMRKRLTDAAAASRAQQEAGPAGMDREQLHRAVAALGRSLDAAELPQLAAFLRDVDSQVAAGLRPLDDLRLCIHALADDQARIQGLRAAGAYGAGQANEADDCIESIVRLTDRLGGGDRSSAVERKKPRYAYGTHS